MSQSTRKGLTPSQLVTLFTTILLISLGLCGANFLLVIRYVPLSGGGDQAGKLAWVGNVLTATRALELIGLVVGLAGLVYALWRRGTDKKQ